MRDPAKYMSKQIRKLLLDWSTKFQITDISIKGDDVRSHKVTDLDTENKKCKA